MFGLKLLNARMRCQAIYELDREEFECPSVDGTSVEGEGLDHPRTDDLGCACAEERALGRMHTRLFTLLPRPA